MKAQWTELKYSCTTLHLGITKIEVHKGGDFPFGWRFGDVSGAHATMEGAKMQAIAICKEHLEHALRRLP